MIDIILKVVFPVKFLFLNRNKTDSIYTTKSEDKNSIPWDELTKKGKETKEEAHYTIIEIGCRLT